MLDIARVRVKGFSVDYLDLFWDLVPTFEDVLDYEFVVQRSLQQYSNYSDISPAMINRYRFRDATVQGQHARYRGFWYRVQITKRSDPTKIAYAPAAGGGGVRMTAEPDLYALEFSRHENLRLQEFAGRKALIFPKLAFGQHCPNCVDQIQRRKMRSNCLTCYDTGYVGGFGRPVECYIEVTTAPEVSQTTPQGKMEIENTRFKLGNFPEVNEGDLVVEGENIRWAIGDPVIEVTKARAMFRQQGTLFRLDRSDITYKVPINWSDAEVMNLLPTPERNYTNPSTFDGGSVDEAISKIFGGRSAPS